MQPGTEMAATSPPTMPRTFLLPPTRRSAVLLPDALRQALGQIISNERREWRRERELIEAQAQATIAEFRAENTALLARIEEAVSARLSKLRDGPAGADGAPGPAGADGAPGIDGADGAPGRDGVDGAPGVPGRDGTNGIDGTHGRDGADGQPGRDGADGAAGRDGERGPEGAPGKLPIAHAWTDRVHYEGDVVTHEGAAWQALRDTGRAPGTEDWHCIAAAGRDGSAGRSFEIRGTWSEGEAYQRMDVVALNGASFVARRDDPGACPGEGWQMIAAQGKRGNPGEAGRPLRGEPGPPGPAVIEMRVSDDGLLQLRNADGSTVDLDLYPLLSQIASAR